MRSEAFYIASRRDVVPAHNVLTLAIYSIDKTAARKTRRKCRNPTLLVFGVVGGWLRGDCWSTTLPS